MGCQTANIKVRTGPALFDPVSALTKYRLANLTTDATDEAEDAPDADSLMELADPDTGAESADEGDEGAEADDEEGVEFLETKLEVWSRENTASEFGRTFASVFYACDVQFTNTTDEDVLLYGGSLTNYVHYRMSLEDVETYFGYVEGDDPSDLIATLNGVGEEITDITGFEPFFDYLTWAEDRRPMSYSDILAIFEHHRRGNGRQRVIDTLQFVGALATGAGVFVNSPDYATGVALFTGIFTPELEKLILWDILLNLQNLEKRSLKEIEEVPAYGQIHRVVFYPRGAIHGLISGVPVYIAEIQKSDEPSTAKTVAIRKLTDDASEVAQKVQDMIAAEVAVTAATADDTDLATAAIAYLKALNDAKKAKAEADEDDGAGGDGD